MQRKIFAKTLLLIGMVFLIPLLLPTVVAWTTNGTRVAPLAEGQAYAQLCSDGVMGAIITWQDHRTGASYDIYAQRVDSAGQVLWDSQGVVICNATGPGNEQEDVQIVGDGAGGAVIAWADHRDTQMAIYAQRVNAAGETQWTANGSVVRSVVGTNIFLYYLRICSDGANGAIVVWRQRQTPSSLDYDLYAQRINATGDVLWGTNGTTICNDSSNQEENQIATDGANGAIITWKDYRGGDETIYAQRVNSTGHPQWTTNGIIICDAAGIRFQPQIVSDGVNGAVIAWDDDRGGENTGIYAQRVNSTGHAQWTGNGTAVCNGTDGTQNPSLIRAGAGSFILTWLRNTFYADVYAQRINASGVGQWTPNGIPILSNLASGNYPKITSDGQEGAIILWSDDRVPSDTNLYAQRVTSAGVPRWTLNGTAVCTNNHSQSDFQLVNAGSGAAIFVWQDDRTTFYNIYTIGLGFPGGTNGGGIPGFELIFVLITLSALIYSMKQRKQI